MLLLIFSSQYIVLLDKANNASPIRHIRGPAKIYPTPYEEPVLDERKNSVRKWVEINDATAIWLKQPDGLVLLVDQPQFYMPGVGEKVEKAVPKTLLKESEFCIMIMPSSAPTQRTPMHSISQCHSSVGASCISPPAVGGAQPFRPRRCTMSRTISTASSNSLART